MMEHSPYEVSLAEHAGKSEDGTSRSGTAELLAPAGSLEALRAAVNAGADAVYIGGRAFGARAYADNPDEAELIEGIEYCHLRGRKVYLTVNTLLKEHELRQDLLPFLMPLYLHGVDALIVQDLGVVRFLREQFPDLKLHASTQMSVTTAEGAALLARHGISRVVPARELSLGEIRTIADSGMEVETFVHGAICYCYSGRCLLSSMLGGRSGNRGRCAQPCRLPYTAEAPGYRRDGYPLSMKDMCTLDILPDLLEAGIVSFKIEDRMKQPAYAAGVTSVYRKYLDLYARKGRAGYRVEQEDRQILLELFDRGGFSKGYYHSKNGPAMIAMERPKKENAQAAQKKVESNRRFLQENMQVKINGDLRIFPDKPVILELWCAGGERGDRYSVKVTGGAPAMAETTAATKDDVSRQMRKTGNTPFLFEHLEIHLADGLFLPVRMLNELRRDALRQLQEKILCERGARSLDSLTVGKEYCPENAAVPAGDKHCPENMALPVGASRLKQPEPAVNLLVTTSGQLDAVLDWIEKAGREKEFAISAGLDTIYLDSMLFSSDKSRERVAEAVELLRQWGLQCYFAAPPVLREEGRAWLEKSSIWSLLSKMDGFLVQSVDELEYFRRSFPNAGFASEDCLYAFNTAARKLLCEEGISRFTFPAELNGHELKSLEQAGSELIIYGYQALMQSAQCVRKNTIGCMREKKTEQGENASGGSILYLRDRKNIRFPVMTRCPFCTNTIYNSIPLRLGGCREEIRKLHPSFFRISFTIESAKETGRILNECGQWFGFSEEERKNRNRSGQMTIDTNGTRGHFKRGVE
ncbi:MAG: U32 family peptidase [Lachnospiraceae bacterium]|nr:U32 family peptidase [Lachnospiraceae bacterium]